MFGSGPIEMLAREMTADLQALAGALPDGIHVLTTKGVDFKVEVSGGDVVKCWGVDTDLIIKPYKSPLKRGGLEPSHRGTPNFFAARETITSRRTIDGVIPISFFRAGLNR
jgi:hypothetical protein